MKVCTGILISFAGKQLGLILFSQFAIFTSPLLLAEFGDDT
jgi:hypothetical protein